MIQTVISTQSTSTGNYYFVTWRNDQMPPCWIDEKIYQEAIDSSEMPVNSSNIEKKEKKAKKEEFKIHEDIVVPTLDKEKASSRLAIVQFFAWRKQKSSKELTEAEKKRKEGVKRYDSPLIQSLQRICSELEARLQQPNQETYDDLIDYIQGYAFSKSHRMFLVANLLGKKKKTCIPLKNMKKYFPQTLKDYLQEIIELQKDSHRKKQLGNAEYFPNANIEREMEGKRYEGNSYYFQDSSGNPQSRQNRQKKSRENKQRRATSSQDINSPSRIFPSMSIDATLNNHTNFLANFFSSDPTLQFRNKVKPEGVKRSNILYRSDSEDSSDEEQGQSME